MLATCVRSFCVLIRCFVLAGFGVLLPFIYVMIIVGPFGIETMDGVTVALHTRSKG